MQNKDICSLQLCLSTFLHLGVFSISLCGRPYFWCNIQSEKCVKQKTWHVAGSYWESWQVFQWSWLHISFGSAWQNIDQHAALGCSQEVELCCLQNPAPWYKVIIIATSLNYYLEFSDDGALASWTALLSLNLSLVVVYFRLIWE